MVLQGCRLANGQLGPQNVGLDIRFWMTLYIALDVEESLRNFEHLDALALDDPSPKRLNLAIHQNKHVKPPRPNVAVVVARLTIASPQTVLYE